jgi:hypothetical protein
MAAVGGSRWTANVTIREYGCETVKRIGSLGYVLYTENLIKAEINTRIISGNELILPMSDCLN